MASFTYTRGLSKLVAGTNFTSADIRALLVGSGYSPDVDHDYVSDITPASNECSGSNYARKDSLTKTVVIDDGNNRIDLKVTPITWTALGVCTPAPTGLILYLYNGAGDASSELICYCDISVDKAPNGGDWTFRFDGIDGAGAAMRITAS